MTKPVIKLLLVVAIFNKAYCAAVESETGNPCTESGSEGTIDIAGSGGDERPNCSGVPAIVQKHEDCGWRNPDGVGFVIKSQDDISNFGEFPWMAAVLSLEKTNFDEIPLSIYIGGGSLIHPSVVLTAAHLVVNKQPKTLRVRAGEWDTQTKTEIYPYQERDVASVLVHEGFDKGNLRNNIALLFLAKPLEVAPNVGFACLPSPQQKAQPGTKCYSLGWGKDKFGKEGRYSTILKKVEMPVVDNETCEKKLRDTRLGKWFELDSTAMCAGEKDKYSCKGDGGSPLVCPLETKDRYVQNGIVAWSIGCSGEPPSVFVDVAVFRDWIDEKIKSKGYETNTYSFA